MDTRSEKLDTLNSKLNPQKELGGVFLPKDSLRRFDFMFIAEMPSKKKPKDWDGKSNYNFNVTKRDKFFQRIIVKYGVAGNYATDIAKEINIPRRPTTEEKNKWLSFLLEEIEIIHPKYIVVVGEINYKNNFRKLIEPLISKDIKVNWVYHYRQQGRKSDVEVEQRFAEVIKNLEK